MKETIQYHKVALKETIGILSKGKFLVYFIPGIVAVIAFAIAHSLISSIFGLDTELSQEAKWYSNMFVKVGSTIDFLSKQLYIFLVITLFSPINTLLSEKVDTYLTGQEFNFSIIRLINDLIRMIFIVLIALTFELIAIGVWWFISWILGITDTFIYPIISFCIGAFFFGFSFYDHSLERYRISVGGSLQFAFGNIALVFATGMIFKLLYYFPFKGGISYIGIMIAPVLTTIISTIVYVQYRNLFPKQPIEKTQLR